jgi:hypothetical protein
MVLVVNDRVHEDFNDLEDFNVKYFTFQKEDNSERNGCMIRNYVLKRVQSKIICMRDPEMILEGNDHIADIIDMPDIVHRTSEFIELAEQETQKVIDNPLINLNSLGILRRWDCRNNRHEGFHAGYSAYVKRLVEMGGYDEDFWYGYGYEDCDLLARLKMSGVEFNIDERYNTFHIWHPRMRSFMKTIKDNGSVYEHKIKKLKLVANEGKEWGMG